MPSSSNTSGATIVASNPGLGLCLNLSNGILPGSVPQGTPGTEGLFNERIFHEGKLVPDIMSKEWTTYSRVYNSLAPSAASK